MSRKRFGFSPDALSTAPTPAQSRRISRLGCDILLPPAFSRKVTTLFNAKIESFYNCVIFVKLIKKKEEKKRKRKGGGGEKI